MFVGRLTRSVDAKGRLLVPSEMVRTLDASDREGYYLAPGNESLLVYTRSVFHRLADDMAAGEPLGNFDFNRAFFGQAAFRPADSMGRILLPEDLRQGAGIGGEAVLVGCGRYMEIWAVDRLEAKGPPPLPLDLLAARRKGEGGTSR